MCIVTFSETRVAAITHTGSPGNEHYTFRKLIAWKLERQLTDPAKHRHYGLHYADPGSVAPDAYRADFCLSFDGIVGQNPFGIFEMVIPEMRCAFARDVGSRSNNRAAASLYERWLPSSGESLSEYPMIFHYVNTGPDVKEDEAITDVYLPLK
ncbi:MAG: hypothetical protein HGB20_01835 [Chlorobiaceae bacterium]|nr:hypothetical protein [Chlorobiaceae bacterium]